MDWTALGHLIRQAAQEIVATGGGENPAAGVNRRLLYPAVRGLAQHQAATVNALLRDEAAPSSEPDDGGRP